MIKGFPLAKWPEFCVHMGIVDDAADDMPDGAWFQLMEETAAQFLDDKEIKCVDANDAVQAWLDSLQ